MKLTKAYKFIQNRYKRVLNKHGAPRLALSTLVVAAVSGLILYHLAPSISEAASIPILSRAGVQTAGDQARFISSAIAPVDSRATSNRPDETTSHKIQALYILPKDGEDRNFDTNGRIKTSVGHFQEWMKNATGGAHQFRMDEYNGSLDITFHRLNKTDAQIAAFGSDADVEIRKGLEAAGLVTPNKIYAVYYDGTNDETCGSAHNPGEVAVLYLKAEGPNKVCGDAPIGQAAGSYKDLTVFHEVMHNLGFVPKCALHYNSDFPGHITGDVDDIMYLGPGKRPPTTLDKGHNDYYNHSNPSCPDLADSPYLRQAIAAPAPSPPVPAPSPAPAPPVGNGCVSLGNSVVEGTTGRYAIAESFVNCVGGNHRIGVVEVHLKSVGSTAECADRNKTTSSTAGDNYGMAVFTGCPVSADGSPKVYEVSYINRPGYHVKADSPTKVGTRFHMYSNKTPILRIVIEKDAAPAPPALPSAPAPFALYSGQCLYPGQYLRSPNGVYTLLFQSTDGNLAIYSPARAIWQNHTYNKNSAILCMQGDGILAQYNTSWQPLWYTPTHNSGADRVYMQDDGNLVLYNAALQPVWASWTNGQY